MVDFLKFSGNLNRVLVKAMIVVVADSTIPEKELQRAEQLSIPVVSTEWVIQSLIAGKRLGYRDRSMLFVMKQERCRSCMLKQERCRSWMLKQESC